MPMHSRIVVRQTPASLGGRAARASVAAALDSGEHAVERCGQRSEAALLVNVGENLLVQSALGGEFAA